MKNLIEGINNRLELTEERIREFDDRSIDNMQSEEHSGGKRIKKNW